MKLTVRNFRKVESADIDLSKFTFICGNNEQGKTSICQALSALLTNDPKVLPVTKKDAAKLVRDGSKDGVTSLQSENGIVSIRWPEMAITSESNPPRSSLIAAGRVKLTAMPKDEMAGLIAKLTDCYPTEKDFMEALSPICGEKRAASLWERVKIQGWDATCEEMRRKATDLKAEWRVYSKDIWGSKKGETWKPEGFTLDLEHITEDELTKDIAEKRVALESSIAENAVTDAEIDRLKAVAKDYDGLLTRKRELDQLITDWASKIEILNDELSAIGKPVNKADPLECPHCTKSVLFVAGALVPAETVDDKAIAEQAAAYSAKNSELITARETFRKYDNELNQLKPRGLAAKEAKAKLAELEESGALAAEAAPDRTAEFREALAVSEKRLSIFRQWKSAAETHSRITVAISVADEIDKDGLRQRKAQEGVAKFNRKLKELCGNFDIDPIMIDGNMQVFYRTHEYAMLSESAQFRVDTVLQCAVADFDDSACIIVDGADVIVGKNRSGLINMLMKTGKHVLVSMSLAKKDSAPSLGSAGNSYWLENSVATKME
ncbi:MAG: AAA family ATPase [Candidatus Binatia bacterium]